MDLALFSAGFSWTPRIQGEAFGSTGWQREKGGGGFRAEFLAEWIGVLC
jgi:hypothetical protein